MDRLLNVLLAVMLFATAAGIVSHRNPEATTDSVTNIQHGINALVQNANYEQFPVSSIPRGRCAYVVLFSARCAASQAVAHQWRHDLVNDTEPFPEDWQVIWLNDSSDSADFKLPAPPVRVLYSVDDEAVRRELRLRGYPAHVVLDREGRIVSGRMGGLLPPKAAFRSDCTIRPFYETERHW